MHIIHLWYILSKKNWMKFLKIRHAYVIFYNSYIYVYNMQTLQVRDNYPILDPPNPTPFASMWI